MKSITDSPQIEVDKIFTPQRKKIHAMGIKVHFNHPVGKFHDETWQLFSEMKHLKIIHLDRRNIIRSYTSEKISIKLDKYNAKKDQDRPPLTDRRISLTKDELIGAQKRYACLREAHDNMFSDHDMIHLYYEDIVNDLTETSEEICRFLSLKYKGDLKQKSSVFNPEPLAELVTNHEELENDLRNTDLEWMLDN